MFKNIFVFLILATCLSCGKEEIKKPTREVYPLPGDQFFPEGIAYNSKTGIFYTGSVFNGDIVQVNVESGETKLFSSGASLNRTACTGMKIDSKDRLWVCGGSEGKVHVFNLDGSLIQSWDLKALYGAGFVNDCIIANDYIYFTDSQVKKIYRASVANAQPGNVEEWLSFTDQQIPYTTGTNANGIELTDDGRYLILVVSSSGKLYRIERATKNINEIQLNTPVNSGDGLWLEGNKLYVSRNATNLIFPVSLNADYIQGTVGSGFGTNLLFNTTLAKVGNYFLVVNGQLNRRPSATNPTPPAPVLPFSVSRVTIPE